MIFVNLKNIGNDELVYFVQVLVLTSQEEIKSSG